MAFWPFQPSRANADAELLLARVIEASRQPALFGPGRISDTLEGRFEAMALHGALALIRLRADQSVEPLAQAFADKFFRTLDAGLREAGVGDLTVPKRMQKLAGSFYGRLEAYAAALADEDAGALIAAIGRNVFADGAHPFAAQLAAYAREIASRQTEAPVEALFSWDSWRPIA